MNVGSESEVPVAPGCRRMEDGRESWEMTWWIEEQAFSTPLTKGGVRILCKRNGLFWKMCLKGMEIILRVPLKNQSAFVWKIYSGPENVTWGAVRWSRESSLSVLWRRLGVLDWGHSWRWNCQNVVRDWICSEKSKPVWLIGYCTEQPSEWWCLCEYRHAGVWMLLSRHLQAHASRSSVTRHLCIQAFPGLPIASSLELSSPPNAFDISLPIFCLLSSSMYTSWTFIWLCSLHFGLLCLNRKRYVPLGGTEQTTGEHLLNTGIRDGWMDVKRL